MILTKNTLVKAVLHKYFVSQSFVSVYKVKHFLKML